LTAKSGKLPRNSILARVSWNFTW